MKTEILQGDCLERMKEMPDNSVDCCVTSPPYWGLRDYGHEGQIGLEETPEEYTEKMVRIFREVRRILKPEGTLWLNLGDSYAATSKGSGGPSEIQDSNSGSRYKSRKFKLKNGLKPKDLVGIPWRVAFALQADGWWLRQDIIWHKPNPMPESVTDRCTKAHEYIFLLTKSARYYYDHEAIKQEGSGCKPAGNKTGNKGRIEKEGWAFDPDKSIPEKVNKRSVWTVTTKSYSEAHFATFPPDLIEPCILAGCPEGGTVFDPFTGSGTTAEVAIINGRSFLGTELNPEYIKLAEKRIAKAKTGRLPRTKEEVQKTGGQLSILDQL